MPAVIVTGVSRGLGEALAMELLARGCHVLGIGRASSPRLAGVRYRFVGCDLAEVATLGARVAPAFEALLDDRPDRCGAARAGRDGREAAGAVRT